jgi:predicted transposase YdaD
MLAMTPTPHDALFKAVFSAPEHAAGALRSALPRALSARIDFGALALCPGSFIDEKLRSSHSDLLFSATLSGRPALVYLLFEHRSTPHRLMPFRMLRYAVRIWDDWLRRHPNAKRLPAIVSIVLHHGKRGWTRPRSFVQQLDLPPTDRRALRRYVPNFRVIVDDIGVQDDEALLQRATSALVRLAWLCFRYASDPAELVNRVGRYADLVREIWRAPNGRVALIHVLRYIYEIGGKTPVLKLRALAAKKIGKDVEEAIVSYADQLRDEGRKEGQKQGIKKERRAVLLRLLRTRFGDLPEAVTARIKAAKASELEPWIDRILTASTLDDIFSAT